MPLTACRVSLCLWLSLSLCLSLSLTLPLSVSLSLSLSMRRPYAVVTLKSNFSLSVCLSSWVDLCGWHDVYSLSVRLSFPRSRELTLSWWRCCGSCQRHTPTELAHCFFILFLCLPLSLRPFQLYSFHKFSRQLFAFSLCSSGLNSALFVLSTIYLFIKVSLSPDMILCGWLGLKHQLTN